MTGSTLRAVTLDYDHVYPLVTGAVQPDGIRLTVEVRPEIRTAMDDEDIHVVELSWSRHLGRLAEGDDSWVALPILPRRAFCHRAWFVRADSPVSSFAELAGGRIGITEYPATGNTWARAAAREGGLDTSTVDWVIGSFDGGPSGSDTGLPGRISSTSKLLVDLLTRGELDAVVCQLPPKGYYEGAVPVRRLLPDYAAAEKAYYGRTSIFPAHHVLGVRRPFFEAHRRDVVAVFDAFERARLRWQAMRLRHGDSSPWLMPDIEEAMRLIGPDWQPNGSGPNRHLTSELIDVLVHDELISRRLDVDACFAEFDAASKEYS